MKFEPFPPHLLGKPVEEIDQFVYEKVAIILFLPLLSLFLLINILSFYGRWGGCHVDLTRSNQDPETLTTVHHVWWSLQNNFLCRLHLRLYLGINKANLKTMNVDDRLFWRWISPPLSLWQTLWASLISLWHNQSKPIQKGYAFNQLGKVTLNMFSSENTDWPAAKSFLLKTDHS